MPTPQPFATGTAAALAGTSFTLPGGVTVHCPALAKFFKSTGSVVIAPENLTLKVDNAGLNTILLTSKEFALTPGQDFDIALEFGVHGSSASSGFLNSLAVTEDAMVTGSITIGTKPPTVIESDNDTLKAYGTYTLGDYIVTVNLQGTAGDGTVALGSYGLHFGVPVTK